MPRATRAPRRRSTSPIRSNAADSAVVAVAEAAHGLDRYRVRVLRVELPTQVPDIELDLVAGDAVRVPPDELQQLLARQHLARVPDEGRQEPELERRQRDVAAVALHGTLCEIDADPVVRVRLLPVVA